jgi:hypothetical protein
LEYNSIYDETIRPELGNDAPPPRVSPIPLPPSPFPDTSAQEAYDKTFSQSRVIAVFSPILALAPPFPIQITLTLVAAPGSRIAAATFSATFLDGEIKSILPVDVTSSRTEVHHTDSHGSELSATIGTPATVPVQVTGGVKGTDSAAQDYTRHTWGRIQGTGIGTKKALWIFEEDQGKAGRHGIPVERATETLTIELSVRPAVCEYEIEATVVRGDGKEAGLLNSREHKSGPQRVLLA